MGDFVKTAAVIGAGIYTGGAAFGAMGAAGAAGGAAAAGAGASALGTGMAGMTAAQGLAASSMATAGTLTGGAAAASTGFLGMSAGTWSLLGTGAQMVTGYMGAQAQEQAYKAQAEQERVAAVSREVQRKRRLVSSLSAQNAMIGSMGITPGGSPAAVMRSDIGASSYDAAIARGESAARISQYSASASAARKSGLISAGSSLLEYGEGRALRG